MTKSKQHKIVYVDIDDLRPADYNPRQISEHDYQHLKESLTEFDAPNPIIVNSHPDRKMVIIGGHQRVRVARDLGWETIPCVFVNLTYERERQLNLRLNRNNGHFDYDKLANEFEMDELLDVGFKEGELIGFDEEDLPDDPLEDNAGTTNITCPECGHEWSAKEAGVSVKVKIKE